jgi:glycosyltransferase involved in cell wall biosynthesis
MKIVHLIDYYQPWMGYQETYLAIEQSRLGHEVWVVAADRYMPRTKKIIENRFVESGITEEDGVKIWRLPVYYEFTTNNGYVVLKGLQQVLEKIKPDVVHVHGIISINSILAATYKHKFRYHLVCDNHTSFLNFYQVGEGVVKKAAKAAAYKIFSAFLGFYVVPKVDKIVAIGEEEKIFLQWLFGKQADNFPIIHLGADHRKFTIDCKARTNYRESLHFRTEDLVFGHAGKIQQSKGIEIFLRALSPIKDEQKRFKLLLVGSIEEQYKQHLLNLANDLHFKDLIYFHPFATREELPNLLNAMDIAVWPDDITITAIEAMAVGLPIITCRSLYTQSIIGKYSAGLLVKRNEINELTLAIKSLVEDTEKRKVFSRNARNAVESELNWEKISIQFINLY